MPTEYGLLTARPILLGDNKISGSLPTEYGLLTADQDPTGQQSDQRHPANRVRLAHCLERCPSRRQSDQRYDSEEYGPLADSDLRIRLQNNRLSGPIEKHHKVRPPTPPPPTPRFLAPPTTFAPIARAAPLLGRRSTPLDSFCFEIWTGALGTNGSSSCEGVPPRSCSAFGNARQSLMSPLTCNTCPADLGSVIALLCFLVLCYFGAMYLYVRLVERFPDYR